MPTISWESGVEMFQLYNFWYCFFTAILCIQTWLVSIMFLCGIFYAFLSFIYSLKTQIKVILSYSGLSDFWLILAPFRRALKFWWYRVLRKACQLKGNTSVNSRVIFINQKHQARLIKKRKLFGIPAHLNIACIESNKVFWSLQNSWK